jgi:hypothetical protein
MAGSDENHDDNCLACGLVNVGETKEDVRDNDEG